MKRLIVIPLLAFVGFCNGQIQTSAQTPLKMDTTAPPVRKHPIESTDGIVYFSNDMGLTWENKSEGLPLKTNLGLSAIAASGNTLALASKDNGIYLFDFSKNRWVSIPTDKRIIENNPGALTFYKDGMYIGTQLAGIFYSKDQGNTWRQLNTGLTNLAIRKLVSIDHRLYAGTDAGLYAYNELQHTWEPEYGNSTLQVNGITAFEGSIYIGTNEGVFATSKAAKEWKQVLANRSLHNISSDNATIYAMTYNELLSSTDKGKSWQSIQKGLPAQLYTFNVIENGNSVFAGQWDGVYRKDNAIESWRTYSRGLPEKFAVTNMTLYKGILVVSGSERKLRKGMTTDK